MTGAGGGDAGGVEAGFAGACGLDGWDGGEDVTGGAGGLGGRVPGLVRPSAAWAASRPVWIQDRGSAGPWERPSG